MPIMKENTKEKLDNIITIVKKDCNRMFLAFYYSPFIRLRSRQNRLFSVFCKFLLRQPFQ